MKRLATVVCLLVLACCVAATSNAQVTELSGHFGSNSTYHIKVPAQWNGDLVIWNHGFSLDPPEDVPDLGPLANLQLSEGYAVAASSYRAVGWATFGIQQDLKNLYDLFRRSFGVPAQVIVTGGSFGGLVTIQAIEEAKIGNVVGGLVLSGAIAGSPNWGGALDARLVYDTICSAVPGAAIPGGAAGLPKDSAFTRVDLATALYACFGVPGQQSPEQLQRAGLFVTTMRIPPEFVPTAMGYATFGLADLTWDPHKLSGKSGVGNLGVDYGFPFINASIERIAANMGAQNKLEANYTPTGDTRGAKIVAIHTDKDGLVVVENVKAYADLAPPDNFTAAVVVEATPTHVGFTQAEAVAAWESLRAWLEGAPQPGAVSIQGLCSTLVAGGLAAGPCRFDPTFVIQDLSTRIRPR